MKEIQALIAKEMRTLHAQIHALVQHDEQFIQQVNEHVWEAPGKQIRPMFVFLVAGACGGTNTRALRGALLVTLLHQASLAHDDVVDESSHRRQQQTIHKVWGHKLAVLFGDYLLSKILCFATEHHEHDLLTYIAQTTHAMSTGELYQLAQVRKLTTTEKVYLDIVYQKTAHFFGTCFAIGATAAGAHPTQTAMLRQAGEHFGMAFQLRDDWLDYSNEYCDKPTGMDLRGGKLTLPLIQALRQTNQQQRQEIMHMLQHTDPQQQSHIINFVRKSNGMEYTQILMHHYLGQARKYMIMAKTKQARYQQGIFSLMQHII